MALDRRQLQAQADQALRRGDLTAAAACYRQLLAQTPNDLALLQKLGDALARSNQGAEARAVFRRLAEEYWKGGLRSRALAVLRRAARLEGPDIELLALFGQRLLDEGLVVDAREPLAEAARLAEKAGDPARARSLFERLADNQPKDLFSREALVRLADAERIPARRARARMNLAAALARSDDAAGARRAVGDAFKADPEGLAALSRISELRGAIAETGITAGAPPGGLPDAATLGWAVLWGGARERPDPQALQLVERMAKNPGALPPHLALAAARLLAESARGEACLALIKPLTEKEQPDPEFAAELGDVLTILGRRASETPGVRELLDRRRAAASAQPASAGPARPATVGAPASPDHEIDEKALLPAAVQARALEAQSFVRQGLVEQARQALESIPEQHRRHPKLAPIFEKISPSTPILPAPAAQPKSAAPPVDEELILVVDGDDAERPAPAPAAQAVAAPARVAEPGSPGGSREKRAAGRDVGIDVDELAKSIGTVIDPSDAETTYQMAVGLLEMDLVDQAVPLLERVLADPFRRIDAALLLASAHVSRGAVERAFAQTLAIQRASADAPARMRGELLAVLADLSLRLENFDAAREFVEELNRDLPGHPAASELADRLKASRD